MVALGGAAYYFYYLPQSRKTSIPQPTVGQLVSFEVSRPNLVAVGRNLSKVEIWAVPTGTGITPQDYSLLGEASSSTSASGQQNWIFPIPQNPILATEIFARGFDLQGNKVGDKSLPLTGATEIYNALWGPETSEEEITVWDNTRTFSYPLDADFNLKLDRTRYPQDSLEITPAGLINEVSSSAPGNSSYYVIRYKTFKTGTCVIKNNDFSVNIKFYDPQTGNQTYNNAQYGFSFTYSPRDIFNENINYEFVTNNSLARVDLPRNDFADTNLGEAAFIVGASSTEKAQSICLEKSPIENKQDSDLTIDGITFKVFEGTDVGAGNLYQSTSYRTVRNNTCYEAVLLLHSGNIFNYPTGEVEEFNQQEALGQLEAILNTFKIAD